ncbi:LysR family transcriptional regulator [Aliivibrio wodanis]|uniref:LysR family transcriptional regulator n=1 Tax=Aliivibrio wodanis TaxID=80852 RepID=UPI00406D4BF1
MRNYKLLQALASILETTNLTESAKQLNVTQSAMSKTLAHIRIEFSDPILIREGNSLVLTKRAQHLKAKLPQLLQQLEALYSPQEIEPRTIERTFIIGFNEYVAPTILPHICAKMEKESPYSMIECQLWKTEQFDSLVTTPIDLVATIANDIPDNIYGKSMGQDQFVVMMCAQHPKAQSSFSLDDLADARHILVSGIVDRRQEVDALLSPTGKKRKTFAVVPSFLSAVQSLKLTQAIMVTPTHIAAQYVDNYDLVIKPLPIDIPEHDYYLLWHAKYQNDQEHRWFRNLVFPLLQDNLASAIEKGKVLLQRVL